MIYKNTNIGSEATPNYQAAVLLEPNDIPTSESYSYIRNKYKPGWHFFTAEEYGREIAPFEEFQDIIRHLPLRTLDKESNKMVPYYKKDQQSDMAMCAQLLKALNSAALQLRETSISQSNILRELKKQHKENILTLVVQT